MQQKQDLGIKIILAASSADGAMLCLETVSYIWRRGRSYNDLLLKRCKYEIAKCCGTEGTEVIPNFSAHVYGPL
jgi:hypothetical protein